MLGDSFDRITSKNTQATDFCMGMCIMFSCIKGKILVFDAGAGIYIYHRFIFLQSFSDLFLSYASTSLSSVQLILLPCPSPTSSLFPSRLASLPHPSKCLSIPGYRCPHLFLSPGPYLCLSVHRCPLWPATAVPPCAATKC